MDYDFQAQANQPQSHYERIVLKDNDISLNQNTKNKAFQYMDQLEGWCTNNKASILVDLVFMFRPKVVVEIGVFGGKSLVPMALALKMADCGMAYGVDPWDSAASVEGMDSDNYSWWSQLDHKKILHGLQYKILIFGLENHIKLIQATSEEAAPIPNIDLLHIDGNHSERTSLIDIKKWVPLVRRGGLIILDDITWEINTQSSQSKSTQWLDENCVKLAEFHDTINDWGIWIKL